ncbi:MAG: YCF48-related protein, partial [Ignavibacteria bacterium]
MKGSLKFAAWLTIIIFVLLINFNNNLNAQWFWQNPLPQGSNLNRVCFFDSNNGITVGDAGMIMCTTNGGVNWNVQSSVTGSRIYCVTISDSATKTAIAVGTGGTIIRTTNGGTNWTLPASGITNDLYAVDFSSKDKGTAVGNTGKILRTTDGGLSWFSQTSGVTSTLYGINLTDDLNGLVASGLGKILRTTNGGDIWTSVTAAAGIGVNLYDVLTIDTNSIIAVGSQGRILRSTNGGVNWVAQISGISNVNIRQIAFTDPNTGTVVCDSGKIIRTTNGGVNWNFQTSGTNKYLRSITFSDANTGIAVGYLGTILRTTNGGINWSSQTSGAPRFRFLGTSFINANTGTVVGDSGAIYQTTNSGVNWNPQTSGIVNQLNSVFFANANTGTAVGMNGTIIRTTNGGVNWYSQTSGTLNQLKSVFFTDADNGTTVGFGGVILRTSNGGVSWNPQTSGETNDLQGVFFTDANTGTVVGGYLSGADPNAILRTTNGGVNWIPQTSGVVQALQSVFFTDANTGIIAGLAYTILRTTNGGATWTPIITPVITNFWSVSFADANNGTMVGGAPLADGSVLNTSDGGLTWNLQTSGSSNVLYSVAFPDANTRIAVGDNGTIIKSYITSVAPTLSSPANNSVDLSVTPVLDWNDVSYAVSYRVQVSTSSDFNTTVYDSAGLIFSAITIPTGKLTNNTQYYWRVNATNITGTSAYSTVWNFTTAPNAPNSIVLLSPANNATNQVFTNLVFTWSKALETVKRKSISNYWFELTTDSTFATVGTRDSLLTDTIKTVAALTSNKKYWWRVKAKNQIGWGAFTGVFTFKTAVDPTFLWQNNFTAVLIPQIMSCGGTTRMPVVIRATVSNLIPNKLYRFYNGGAAFTDIGAGAFGAGNPMFINPDSAIYRYTSAASLTTAGGYDVFRANGSGTYTGWFSFVNTANARFTAGKYIIPSIQIGDSLGVLISRFALNDSIKVVNFSTNTADTCGTGIYGISVAFPKNIVSLYDNASGTGKPLSQTYLETEGVTVASIAPFYTTNVEGQNGRWGTVIPNNNANGVRRVEQRNMVTGVSMIFNTDADGVWPSGVNTVSPTGGLAALGLQLGDAPLLNYPVLVSPANNSVNQLTSLKLDWNTVTFASSYRVQLATDSAFTTIVRDSTIIADSLQVTGLSGNTNYWWRVAGITTTGTAPYGTAFKFTTMNMTLSLNLKVYLEGFWNGTAHVSDTVTVYLANSTTPYAFVDTAKVVLSGTGTASMNFNRVTTGSYYIVVSHR